MSSLKPALLQKHRGHHGGPALSLQGVHAMLAAVIPSPVEYHFSENVARVKDNNSQQSCYLGWPAAAGQLGTTRPIPVGLHE